MKKLIQANDDALTNGVTAGEVALCKTLNENGETLGTLGEVENGVQSGKTTLQRVYETIEDNGMTYNNVLVEGVTPNRMKNLLNGQITKANPDSATISFQTPGEEIVVNNGETSETKEGVVQIYNNAISEYTPVDPEIPVITISTLSGETELLGKTADDLQSNIAIEGDVVSGTSKYVTDYTEFSSNEEEQKGNYLALKFEATNSTNITCQLSEATSTPDLVELDSDGIFIARLHSNTQTITVVATGTKSTTTVLKLTGLTLEPEA